MRKVRVIDARMGRGKTSAAMNYMERGSPGKKFIFVTPYLKEVSRVCDQCAFEQPDGSCTSKLANLKGLMYHNRNVAITHSLFYLLDDEILELAQQRRYSLIVDEALNVVQKLNISSYDLKVIKETLVNVSETGEITWRDKNYVGAFKKYMDYSRSHSLFLKDTALLQVMNPKLLTSFDEVILMTYLFNGQYQRAYLDYYGIPYEICGIRQIDRQGAWFEFSDGPDDPPPTDYRQLIRVERDKKLNKIGESVHALSKSWYDRRNMKNEDIATMRRNLGWYYRKSGFKSKEFLWTCFKDDKTKLLGQSNRMASTFLQMTAKASNDYRDRRGLAYLANRFIDPNITKFFAERGVHMSANEFALSELLQWMWRSAIRDGCPVDIYIPSSRMRNLLITWIDENSN